MGGRLNFGKKFFGEITESVTHQINLGYISFFLGVLLLWVYTAIPGQEKNAMIYIVMLLAWGFLNHFDIVYNKLKAFDEIATNGVGKNWKNALLLGVITSIFLIAFVFKGAIVQPFSVVTTNTLLGFLFIVVAAPIVEAQFFRGIIQPTLFVAIKKFFTKNDLIAWILTVILQSAMFALFHVNIFITQSQIFSIESYVPYFLFSVIATIGVYVMRDLSFEFGLHGANNLYAFLLTLR